MPSTLVVDSSSIVDLLRGGRIGEILRARLLGPAVALIAPELIDLEVTHAVRRGWLIDRSTLPRATEMMSAFGRLPIYRVSHGPYVSRVWELRQNLSAYDAVYEAIAEQAHAPLVTRDARLARSSGHNAGIEFIEWPEAVESPAHGDEG